MSALRFTENHEWVRAEGGRATVGISDYAQEQLGDVVYVELPALGQKFARGANVAVVESLKAVGEIYMPLDGTIEVVNERLQDEPELVNSDATDAGWLFKIKCDAQVDVNELMDETAYNRYTSEL